MNNPKLKKYGDSRPDLRVNLPNFKAWESRANCKNEDWYDDIDDIQRDYYKREEREGTGGRGKEEDIGLIDGF